MRERDIQSGTPLNRNHKVNLPEDTIRTLNGSVGSPSQGVSRSPRVSELTYQIISRQETELREMKTLVESLRLENLGLKSELRDSERDKNDLLILNTQMKNELTRTQEEFQIECRGRGTETERLRVRIRDLEAERQLFVPIDEFYKTQNELNSLKLKIREKRRMSSSVDLIGELRRSIETAELTLNRQ